jgi:hypothetical protein
VAQNLKQINSIAKIMASIFGTGKAFFWSISCPMEKLLIQTQSVQHGRGHSVVSKTTDRAYSLVQCVCFITMHGHTLQKK